MQQIKRVLRIPKDPRTDAGVFLTEIPQDLLSRISPEEWKSHIEGLNAIMLGKEKSSIWNTIKLLFVIPAAITFDRYDYAVRKYLKRANHVLKARGLYIEDPSLSGYTELEIVIMGTPEEGAAKG